LNKDNELNKENIEKQHQRILFLSIIIGVSLLLIIIVIIAYQTKRKANILLAKQKQEIIDKTEQLNKQAADIAMYKAQMNPHFLFNAINSVQQFVLEKQSSLALEYLCDLSKLMRSTLNFSDKEFISIKDEIDYLNQYIRFEKLRCDNKFEFHVSIGNEIDAENTCVLPMLIQPFIENAVKHGIIPKTGKGNISLKFEKTIISTNEFLKITIEDDGVGRSAAQTIKQNLSIKHQSKGMKITENRMLKLNEKHFSEAIQGIKIIDKFVDDKSVGTTIELYIPFIELF
jgi:LytS/YehU family sensor histidine kinase